MLRTYFVVPDMKILPIGSFLILLFFFQCKLEKNLESLEHAVTQLNVLFSLAKQYSSLQLAPLKKFSKDSNAETQQHWLENDRTLKSPAFLFNTAAYLNISSTTYDAKVTNLEF
ncbi:hypothetical protein [Leptospira borgpetersenii]|uniref:hypothetical protein n=1 Tax=Leptospira borgpetersenii TaxID=174 RepID=UPI0007748CEC|nr:hypothetical protein [Leptospira borgpetersenii]MBE8365224.1 hypothetical protein [Leptospira borgpetersenii serovar Balcanica]MBE8366585.1 hypothetical protein [Leptospira borgpetersenii serovar Balcanica]MBE8399422.1 hypothetical protein [Leptospira borgpetersenii serovar Tarassovi]MBE8404457.1 hypothetical protein [Leptospira borgpetersenii serovar Tarassovi]MBE8407313.1 hypothetical protein [Leptospira borgpetersenii serovar Tarassovi]